jgi:uncharacterized glyoxalase superfamily protein PhnB
MSETLAAQAPTSAPVKGGAVPYIYPSDASAALDFYARAFAAEVAGRMPAQDGKRLMHAHIYVNGGSIMMSDSFPEFGHPVQVPAGFQIHLQVADGDLWWNRAVAAGCTVAMPFEDQFWGDRYGQLKDPFGITWSVGQTKA